MYFKKALFVLMVCLLFFFKLSAQELRLKVDSLNQAAFELQSSDRELATKLSKHAIELNRYGEYKFGLHLSYLNLGIICTNLSKYDSAFLLLRQCEDYFNDDYESGLTKYYLGINYSNIRSFEKAIRYLHDAKLLFEDSRSMEFIAQVQNSMGIIEGRRANYNQSLEYFLDAYKIRLSNDLPYDQELTNISIVYRMMGELEKSLTFVIRSLEISIELKDTLGTVQNYISVGRSFSKLDRLDSAMHYYDLAYNIAASKGYWHQISSAVLQKANILNRSDQSKEAITVLRRALLLNESDESMMESLYAELSSSYHHLNMADSALYFGKKAYQLTLDAENTALSKTLSLLISDIYHGAEEPDSARRYLQKHVEHLNKLNEKSEESLNSDLRIKIETLEKDNEISLLNNENELKTLREERLLIVIGLLLLLMVALVIWYRSRNKIRELEKQQLEQKLQKGQEDLYKHTLHMIHINNCLDDIETEVSQRAEKDMNSSNIRILNTIKRNKSLDKDWQNFNEYFSTVHLDFYEKLTKLSNSLTMHDKRVCALVKLELTNREIATILNIEAKSVAMVKYRIKKKLELGEEIELDNFIRSL